MKNVFVILLIGIFQFVIAGNRDLFEINEQQLEEEFIELSQLEHKLESVSEEKRSQLSSLELGVRSTKLKKMFVDPDPVFDTGEEESVSSSISTNIATSFLIGAACGPFSLMADWYFWLNDSYTIYGSMTDSMDSGEEASCILGGVLSSLSVITGGLIYLSL